MSFEIKCSDCGSVWSLNSFDQIKGPCDFCSKGCSFGNYDTLRWKFTDLDTEIAYFKWWEEKKARRRQKH